MPDVVTLAKTLDGGKQEMGAMVTRELFDRHDILVHFQPGARDLIHLMPPFIVEEAEIDRLLYAQDDILDRGIADATVRFVIKNLKRVIG